jgi:acetyl-CoA synthetase
MEMEAALLNHPDVAEAAVVGVPDPTKGTAPVAFATLRAGARPGPGIEKELEQRIVEIVGPVARPAAVHVVGSLPKTRSGKIMRRLLRELEVEGRVAGDTTALENPEAVSELEKELAQT